MSEVRTTEVDDQLSVTGPATNRCEVANGTGGFTYNFANGVECASFAAPADFDPLSEPAPPIPPSPEQVAAALLDRMVTLADKPELRVAPAEIGLTGLESFFWLDRLLRTIRATAYAGTVSVIAEATPVEYSWDFDDGTSRSTSGPGRPWKGSRDGSIAHMYETAGRYDLSVEAIWRARWRMGGGPWRPLGYFSTGDSRPYRVRSIVAWLVRSSGGPRR